MPFMCINPTSGGVKHERRGPFLLCRPCGRQPENSTGKSMEIQVLKSGSAVVAHKGQVWLLDAPKGVGDELTALGIVPDTVLTTTVAAPGIAELQDGFKILRQVPLRGDGLEAEAVQRTHGWDYIVKDDTGASFLFSQRGDVSAADVKGHDLSLVGNNYRANAFDEAVLTRPWSAAAMFVAPKVWSKMSEVPANLRKMEDATLSLGQANTIARQAEGIPEGEAEEPYAVAIANFKRGHHKADGRWVKNKEAAKTLREDLNDFEAALQGQFPRPTNIEGRHVYPFYRLLDADLDSGNVIVRQINDASKPDRTFVVPFERDGEDNITFANQDEWQEAVQRWQVKAARFVCPNCGSRRKSAPAENSSDPTCAVCGERMIPDRRRRSGGTVSHAAGRGVVAGLAAGVKADGSKLFNDALATLKAKFPDMAADSIEDEGQLAIFKSDGRWRWATITTAAMWDKQDELVTRKAMDFAIALSTITGERGPLRHEHVPALDIGACDWQMRKGDFLLESGSFDDTPFAQRCRKVYADSPGLYKVSAGLRYQSGDLVDGVYHRMAIFERSVTKTPAVPFTALGVRMFEVSDEMLKQIATEMDWPLADIQALVERAQKSSNPPESLEALKSAIQSGQEVVAMDDLLAKLSETQKAALREKLTSTEPVQTGDGGGDESDLAALKAQVEQLTVEMSQSNKAVLALAEALKGESAQQETAQDAIATFLSQLPRQEAAQFTTHKGGLAPGGETLATIQAQLNEMSQKMDSAIKGPAFDYDAFTSQRLNANRGGST